MLPLSLYWIPLAHLLYKEVGSAVPTASQRWRGAEARAFLKKIMEEASLGVLAKRLISEQVTVPCWLCAFEPHLSEVSPFVSRAGK